MPLRGLSFQKIKGRKLRNRPDTVNPKQIQNSGLLNACLKGARTLPRPDRKCKCHIPCSHPNSNISLRSDPTLNPHQKTAQSGLTRYGPARIKHVLLRGISSAGRARAWHARGHRFDPVILHQFGSFRATTFNGGCFSFGWLLLRLPDFLGNTHGAITLAAHGAVMLIDLVALFGRQGGAAVFAGARGIK